MLLFGTPWAKLLDEPKPAFSLGRKFPKLFIVPKFILFNDWGVFVNPKLVFEAIEAPMIFLFDGWFKFKLGLFKFWIEGWPKTSPLFNSLESVNSVGALFLKLPKPKVDWGVEFVLGSTFSLICCLFWFKFDSGGLLKP